MTDNNLLHDWLRYFLPWNVSRVNNKLVLNSHISITSQVPHLRLCLAALTDIAKCNDTALSRRAENQTCGWEISLRADTVTFSHPFPNQSSELLCFSSRGQCVCVCVHGYYACMWVKSPHMVNKHFILLNLILFCIRHICFAETAIISLKHWFISLLFQQRK